MTLAEDPLSLLADYARAPDCYDEAVDDDGAVRPVARGAMRALEGRDLEELAVEVERHSADEGVVFHSSDGDEVFVIDPVPRVLAAAEWARVEAGLAQRVRALNAFVADVYGERRIVAEGIVPARVIDGAEYFEPGHAGRPSRRATCGSASPGSTSCAATTGASRCSRTTSARPAASPTRPPPGARSSAHLELPPADHPRTLDGLPSMLWDTLRAASPARGSARAVVLTDGEDNSAYYEHEWAAQALGVPLLEPDGLDLDAVDVVYRRTNADRLDDRRRRAAARAGARGPRSPSSTRSGPGSPTTSSPTPTSRT